MPKAGREHLPAHACAHTDSQRLGKHALMCMHGKSWAGRANLPVIYCANPGQENSSKNTTRCFGVNHKLLFNNYNEESVHEVVKKSLNVAFCYQEATSAA